MIKRLLLTTVALLVAAAPLTLAQKPGPRNDKKADTEKKEAPEKPEPELTVTDGLVGVSHHEKDWYFDVPDSLLGRRILAVTRFVNHTSGASEYGGEMLQSQMIYWEKASNGNLLLRVDPYTVHADGDDEIARAVRASSENPIIASLKPEKKSAPGCTRVKVTSLFEGDTQAFSLNSRSKRAYNLGNLKGDASFIESIRTYPINTEVTVTKTYTYSLPQGGAGGPARMSAILPAGLEAGPEDVEKQKRGELVEPVKPIVYYIDPATPKQWRPYLIAGVNDWQKAFEQAGWKNAIRAEEWPEDNPDMSMEDARFSVIRYLASSTANAYGPNVHDPRSGEILESHIGWYHNVMTLVHDWYQVQVGAVDPRARSFKYDDELMGDLIRFVSSHEVGHTLGLRHNMGSSSFTPVEKLRDKEWVEKHGHTVSIMDYARFNYVAQPEDGIGKDGLYPRINDYDKWAIEYGYKPTEFKTPKEDHLYWNKVIIERLKDHPELWFGGEGTDSDPRAQREDLGDDAVAASNYGIANLKRIIGKLPEWNAEEADQYENLSRMYTSLTGQYNRYLGHVSANIGGRFVTNHSIEQAGVDKYAPVPKERQKRALNWLNDNLFRKPSWLVAEPWIFNLTDRPDTYLYTLVNNVVSASNLLNIQKLSRMEQFTTYGSDNYAPQEYLDDLAGMIFEELYKGRATDSYRRYLQRRYVTVALEVVNSPAAETTDGRTLLLGQLLDIQKKAGKAKSSDAATHAHWQSLAKQIEKGLK